MPSSRDITEMMLCSSRHVTWGVQWCQPILPNTGLAHIYQASHHSDTIFPFVTDYYFMGVYLDIIPILCTLSNHHLPTLHAWINVCLSQWPEFHYIQRPLLWLSNGGCLFYHSFHIYSLNFTIRENFCFFNFFFYISMDWEILILFTTL